MRAPPEHHPPGSVEESIAKTREAIAENCALLVEAVRTCRDGDVYAVASRAKATADLAVALSLIAPAGEASPKAAARRRGAPRRAAP